MYKAIQFLLIFMILLFADYIYADTVSSIRNDGKTNEVSSNNYTYYFSGGYGGGEIIGIDKPSYESSDMFGLDLQTGFIINKNIGFNLRWSGFGKNQNSKSDGSGYHTSYGINEYHIFFNYFTKNFIFFSAGLGGAKFEFRTEDPVYIQKYSEAVSEKGLSLLLGTGLALLPSGGHSYCSPGISCGIYYSYQKYINPETINNTSYISIYISLLIGI